MPTAILSFHLSAGSREMCFVPFCTMCAAREYIYGVCGVRCASYDGDDEI